jgi:hypothetical protein
LGEQGKWGCAIICNVQQSSAESVKRLMPCGKFGMNMSQR